MAATKIANSQLAGYPFSSGSSITVIETEIDFGNSPTPSKRFTITDASATPSSKIIVTGSGNTATGGAEDDWEWDAINFVAKSNTGTFTLFAYSNTLIGGKRKIFYTIN